MATLLINSSIPLTHCDPTPFDAGSKGNTHTHIPRPNNTPCEWREMKEDKLVLYVDANEDNDALLEVVMHNGATEEAFSADEMLFRCWSDPFSFP